MVTKKITSLQHPTVKALALLRKSSKERALKGELLIEGKKMVWECTRPLKKLIVAEGAPLPSHLNAQELLIVPPSIIKKIAESASPEPYLATTPLPPFVDLIGKAPLLALDRISDPGNLGTLLRTAHAFGFGGAFLLSCCSPFSPKALRAAKGATLYLPLAVGGEEALLLLIKRGGYIPYVADAKGARPSFTSPTLLILGNESNGCSERLKAAATCVGIPMSEGADSLNVGVAGGILMQEVRKAQ